MIYYLVWSLVGVLFFPAFSILYRLRWDALGYTHAFFILPVSLGLVFWKRKELAFAFAGTEKRFGPASLAILVLGALIYLFGWRQDYMVISTFALIPFLYGFVGFIYGKKVRRLVLFPILYLLLLVPPPFALLDRATLPLRYISAFGVEKIFQLFNFPIQREGLGYVIQGQRMMVDEACSGFRSLITMFSLGLVYVYVIKEAFIKKAVLVLAVLPLALAGNIARIIVISLIAVNFSQEAARGFMHSFSGVVVFLFIVLGFLGIEALWTRDEGRGTRDEGRRTIRMRSLSGLSRARIGMDNMTMGSLDVRAKLNLIIVGLFLVLCVCVVYFVPRAKYAGKAITAEVLDSIPESGRHWQGRDIKDIGDNMEGEVYNFISRIFARQYVNKARPEENVFLIVLDAGNFHYPKVCFQGAGFTSEELPQRELNLAQGKLKAHLMLSKKGNEQLLSVYWICIDKEIVPTWVRQKLKQLYYSLFNKERVGLMVRVDSVVVEDVDSSVKVVEGFLSDIYRKGPLQWRDYIFGSEGQGPD